MLICLQCGFENPNLNNFCQQCGASLTQNTCPTCNSQVPFDVVNCPTCGAVSGVIWRAIVQQESDIDGSSGVPLSSTVAPATYLDTQGRYRLLEPFSGTGTEQQVRVLDCQPFQLSLLDALLKQDGESTEAEVAESEKPAGTEVGTLSLQTMTTLALPALAQPYLALGNRFHQAIPVIHDAWQQEGRQVLLLEDRTEFSQLVDLLQDEELVLPQLQVLHWLYEMVELWEAMDSWHCHLSLLEVPNLRVDEDQALCLERLYFNAKSAEPTLRDLGRVWQRLFDQTGRTQFGELALLLADLDAEKVTTAEALRSRIEAIAYTLQASQPDEIPADDEDMELTATIPPIEESEDDSAGMGLEESPSIPTVVLGLADNDSDTSDEEDGEGDADPTVVLPMQLFSLDDAGRTDVGRQRHHNEDYFGIETQVSRLESPSGRTLHVRNLYILCDGMGGQADGEVASAMAVDSLRRYFQDKWYSQPFGGETRLPSPEVLSEAVLLANKAIFDVNQQNARSGIGRMGTTLVMLLIHDTEAAVVHVGDSRLYRYSRKRGLEQITIDHEVGQREIQRGVERDIAYARPDAYQLTQALGPRDEHFVKPDVQYLELNEDVLLLLCSDGLSDNDLLENHAQTHLDPLLSSKTNLDQGVAKLIDLGNEHNGHDNITAIAVRAKVRPNLAHLR